jgi:primosomal protein N'
MVPRVVNDMFTGRVELLARIQQALYVDITSKPAKQRRFVITGLGGQGKSEVCLQVASIMKEGYVTSLKIFYDTN